VPLDYAAANDRLEIAQLLIENGAPAVDYELSAQKVPLHYAIDRGSLPMVKLLLAAGHSPNTAEGRRGESATSEPAMHMAIAKDRLEIIEALLAQKPDLSIRNTFSQMPLHDAAGLGKANVVKLLIRAGANVKATTLGFSLPCGSGEEERPKHNTPLHFAAAAGNPETIKALLAGGADIDAKNADGKTPLMSAVSSPIYTGINSEMQLKNIEELLLSGANIYAQDTDGKTVLDLADDFIDYSQRTPEQRTQRRRALVEYLEKRRAIRGVAAPSPSGSAK
jgi:ankyrin repeat protein